MKSALILMIVGALCGSPAFAAKTKMCFTKAEQNAEQLVRSGIRLREGASGCDGPPWNLHTKPLWDQIDQKFGPRFKQQTDIRRKAFEREFAKDAENRERMWDGRTVLHFRDFTLSAAYCAEIKTSLETMLKSGWGALANRARLDKDPVEMDYQPCS
jgi:hypothetical protein